ncbi:MAG TPA: BMP family ABC transporter substrate-binding protein [Clostridiales bacterium]|nr:BMP family ABC transporter substrate-binding protein [Clostridiales bacterium]HBP51718.1 BMP family ABC transporter substrate-binding protein [Clostridiales bacterium]HBW06026.1 BMP family ABC transporter substrate-binding protein [Clostridiales bacterium]HCH92071.1 BMP family ABC transporter substrate-binding protein [Clostridiales bacterium]
MKKKVFALVLCLALVTALVIGLVACNPEEERVVNLQPIAKDDIKIGLICLHDEQSTYDKNFIDAMKEAVNELGLREDQLVIKTGIPENEKCYNTAVELVEQGCNIIFADSFGHEDHIMRAAEEYTSVRFFHATGTKAHTAQLGNYFNAFASIYEGRYLAGVAAGMKLVELYGDKEDGKVSDENAKIGYVGAYPYAEVKSGYTSFFLGVRSIVPNATMEVKFTSSWYDEAAENATAKSLIERGCKLISQHADSMGAPNACKEKGIPNVTYNVSTENDCEGSYVIGSRINWAPYYKYIVEATIKNETIPYDWTGTLQSGSVELLELGKAAAQGTAEKLAEVKAALQNGTLNVFDTNNFTVDGKHITSFLADVDDAGDYVPETEVVENGILKESAFRSAPYFTLDIDGITLLK